MGQRLDQAVEGHGDLSADHVLHAERAALVGHVDDLDARHPLEEFRRQVRRAARTRRSVVKLAGFGARQRDQLGDAARRQRGVHVQAEVHVDDLGDRSEVAHRIDAHPGIQVRVDAEIAQRSHEQRVAVGGRFCRDFRADHSARAGAVFHDGLPAPKFTEVLGENACDDIGAAACRKGDDDTHRFRRKALPRRLSARCRRAQRRGQDHQHRRGHSLHRFSSC